MLELTPAAADVVRAIVSQTELPDSAGMRITSEDAGTGENGTAPVRDVRLAVVEAPQADDEEVDGAPVYIEPGVTAAMLDGKVLDASIDDDVVEFRFVGGSDTFDDAREGDGNGSQPL
jgi:hypothetical protein